MFAFYLPRGQNLNDLIGMSFVEKRFLYHAMVKCSEDEKKKYETIFGR